jgi:hypothetical protein
VSYLGMFVTFSVLEMAGFLGIMKTKEGVYSCVLQMLGVVVR